VADEHPIGGGDGDGVIEARATVGDAQFQRRMLQRRPHHPPEEAQILDSARRHQGRHIALVIGKAVEQLGRPVRGSPR
jgi:hypothetical protein